MVRAIRQELTRRQEEIERGGVRTLYFGGGTPSVCSAKQIGGLVRQVRELWQVSDLEEVTLEANPDDLTPEYLSALREVGVDRLSIGVQSFRDEHLRQMNRRHTAQGAVTAVKAAQRAGFGNITIDLIYGLPGMTRREWSENLEQAVGLGVQHLSAYHLTIEPRTIFGKRGLQPIGEAESQWQFDRLRRAMQTAGFEHYEVSNFALPGHRALHNSAYWQGEPYLGAGPSAHSYDGLNRRSWNVAHNGQYLSGAAPQVETLTPSELYNEYLMTRLRTADGIDLVDLARRFGPELMTRLLHYAEPHLGSGHLVHSLGRLTIPPHHFLLSDYLISNLFI